MFKLSLICLYNQDFDLIEWIWYSDDIHIFNKGII